MQGTARHLFKRGTVLFREKERRPRMDTLQEKAFSTLMSGQQPFITALIISFKDALGAVLTQTACPPAAIKGWPVPFHRDSPAKTRGFPFER